VSINTDVPCFITNIICFKIVHLQLCMKQYCIYHRLLLLDKDGDLFTSFCLLICTTTTSVLESHEADDNPFLSHNSQLLIWKCCNLKGGETWKEICFTLGHYITTISQYILFIIVIPGIESFVRVIHCKEKKVYMLCTLISLTTCTMG
jgi:hypothetical protein